MAKATRKTTTSSKTSIATDPIFAAIKNHKKANQAFFAVCRAQEAGLAEQRDVDRAIDTEDRAARMRWR